MNKKSKHGFTMVELMVVLVILAILLSIAIPSLTGYIHLSQFKKNESYAKTMYLSAESTLTYYRTGGQWEDFRRQLLAFGEPNDSFDSSDEQFNRIYAIKLEKGEFSAKPLKSDGALVAQLLENISYDPSILNESICIEIDAETGYVYSAFYGTACDGLVYGSSDEDGTWLNIDQRDYLSRKERRLGYYSVSDVTNVVDLELSRLKINTINLVNSETLSLNWSSNSRHDNLDIQFDIKFYKQNGTELLSLVLNRATFEPGIGSKTVDLSVSNQGGSKKTYSFPLSYVDGRFTLTLDAMMTSELLRALEENPNVSANASTSITRFGGEFTKPLDIYATVQAKPTYQNIGSDTREYKESIEAKSSIANTMFADGSSGNDCKLAAFRHLFNIRYMNGSESFTLSKHSIDYQNDNIPFYQTNRSGDFIAKNSTEIGFPSIPELRSSQTISCEGNNSIRNLTINKDSIVSDDEYLGLIARNHGEIKNFNVSDLNLSVTSSTLKGVGGVCGYSDGILNTVNSSGSGMTNVTLSTPGDEIGIGGIAGVLNITQSHPSPDKRNYKLSSFGEVNGIIPVHSASSEIKRGIGGIIGYASISSQNYLNECINSAAVSGNTCVGGVIGGAHNDTEVSIAGRSYDLLNCQNNGLVLSSADASDTGIEGHYIGGVSGYCKYILLKQCHSVSGRADNFEYSVDNRDMLRGNYVGGILGYGESSLLLDCSTGSGGYVLGNKYVGGIVGGLSGNKKDVIQTQSASVTRNASFVIGNSYVGGIAGENAGNSAIVNCENTGVVAGYEEFIGGICGTNKRDEFGIAQVQNCASYVSDTDNKIYDLVIGWNAVGDCAGGLVGYNSGSITFTNDPSNHITTKSVSSIVVGKDYVGGIVGFNDVEGDIEIYYDLLSGRVYASGDCAGGLVGFNASTDLLEKNLVSKSTGVRGRYYVGGAIGANVVDIAKDTTISSIRNNNSLGTVTAVAFCGGLIGYHRTYTASQLGINDSMLDYMRSSKFTLLPDIDTVNQNVPKPVTPSQNTYTFSINGYNNTATVFNTATNDMHIRAYAYFGGIVGYAEGQGRMIIKNCLNTGSFALPATDTFAGDELAQKLALGVDTVSYLRSQNYPHAADVLEEDLNGDSLRVAIVGGTIGVNGQNNVIDHCSNTGAMNGLTALGGVVGLNQGGVFNCRLSGNIGSFTQDYVGGIVGLNIGIQDNSSYKNYAGISYLPGTVSDCVTENGKTVTGGNSVGGIVGLNMSGGIIDNCTSEANVSGKSSVGGLAGRNSGIISLDGAIGERSRFVNGSQSAVGGIIGTNSKVGVLTTTGNGDIVIADRGLTVRGYQKVGGIIGVNVGTFKAENADAYLVNQAKIVRATAGYAGGIVGAQEGVGTTLSNAKNQGALVTADVGAAGGIVGINNNGNTIINCVDQGNVTSNDGYAGGVVSENHGRVESCTVKGAAGSVMTETRTQLLPYVSRITSSSSTRWPMNDASQSNLFNSTGSSPTLSSGSSSRSAYITLSFSEPVDINTFSANVLGTTTITYKETSSGSSRTLSNGTAYTSLTKVSYNNIRAQSITITLGRYYVNRRYNYNTLVSDININYSYTVNGEEDSYRMTNVQEKVDYEVTSTSSVTPVIITSRGKAESGAICAVNHPGGTVTKSAPEIGVVLSGNADVLGAVVGDNLGTIDDVSISHIPKYSVTGNILTVGGAAGQNRGTITNVISTASYTDFSTYRYLGGIAGLNTAEGTVQGCTYSGTMTEKRSSVGNCYGGIVGLNQGKLSGDQINGMTLTATGVYTAISTSTAEQKEALSSHIGGIAGKNDINGVIEGCYIGSEKSQMTVENGMLGGITGYNKGVISGSGDSYTKELMSGVDSFGKLLENAADIEADEAHVNYGSSSNIESLTYTDTSVSIANGRTMQIIISSNGNIGGIAGYNAPEGQMDHCSSGSWLIVNKSESIGVGTGGIIGMNESENNLSYLVNRAFVGRQLRNGQTNRFAGGIIGNQSNSTTSNWTIESCLNYGTIYCHNTHYSGGIIGQWTANGGTILNCRNYAMLQTTYKTGWVGASAGIVAQLYHASADQDFNIISCQNHGSILGHQLGSAAQCANDSAGILGNITAFAAWDNGQSFTVNVVDCVNGPGVDIYSGSMASGILGFVSSDDSTAYGQSIIAPSTENIIINIDRCRNYSGNYVSSGGVPFYSGIFGDRYGNAGGNTFIQNCFSIYFTGYFANSSNATVHPIISLNMGSSSQLDAANIGSNYYFEDMSSVGTFYTGTGTMGTFSLSGANEYSLAKTRLAQFGALNTAVDGNRYFFMQNGPDSDHIGGYPAAQSGSVQRYSGFNSSRAYIRDGYIYGNTDSDTDARLGKVLFYLPNAYSLNSIKEKGSDFDNYVRETYRALEITEITGSTQRLKAPDNIELDYNNGQFELEITDSSRPLYYEVDVEANGEKLISGLRFIPRNKAINEIYSTSASFSLPNVLESGGIPTVRVRSISFFEDVEPSAWTDNDQQLRKAVLPIPSIRAQLVTDGTDFSYEYSLENLAEYTGNSIYDGWTVSITSPDGSSVELSADSPTGLLTGKGLQQLTAQAIAPHGDDVTSQSSPAVSIATHTPANGLPDASLNTVVTSYAGDTIDQLVITTEITINEASVTTPPIFRVELVGTKGDSETVYAYEDVLVSAGNTVSASFRELDPEVFSSDELSIRAWYASSGQGPVYTYRTASEAEANITVYDNGEYNYLYSTVIDNIGTFNNSYIRSNALDLSALPAPILIESERLEPTRGSSGELQYTFEWDKGLTGSNYNGAEYSVSLTGISSSGAAVSILTDEFYSDPTAKSFTINADDWDHSQVTLTVTRLGDASSNVVGLKSAWTYKVSKRLAAPSQPTVENLDTNELIYSVAWPAISNEAGAIGYQIYVQPEGQVSEAVGDIVPIGEPAYQTEADLEDYEGQSIIIYLVTVSDPADPDFEDSPAGVSYSLAVPMRLQTPVVSWSFNWAYDKSSPVNSMQFENSGLTVTILPDAASKPPGGSTYLIAADIFDTDAATHIGTYPVSDMITDNSGSYTHTLEELSTDFAGKYIVFKARIFSGDGMVSSRWVSSDMIRLPYVKFAKTGSTAAYLPLNMEVKLSTTPSLEGTPTDWYGDFMGISWNGEKNADLYEIALTNRSDEDSTSSTVSVRVQETDARTIIEVSNDGTSWSQLTPDASGVYTLIAGKSEKKSYFSEGIPYYYTYTLNTLLKRSERADGTASYTLYLPNVSSMTTQKDEVLNLNIVKTTNVSIVTNVIENLDTANPSTAYIPSDEAVHTFGN